MEIIELLILLVIAGICGALAELVVGFSPGGFVVSIVVGLIGAYLGTAIGRWLGLPELLPVTVGGQTLGVVHAILGSIVLLLVISLFRGAGRRRRGRLL